MKVPPRQISTFLRQPPAEIRAALLHGTDVGLIAERSKTLALLYADDDDDVFSVTRLDGDKLVREPGLIADSAASIAMFSDVRLVVVKGRGSDLLEACKLALASDLSASFVVVEASDTTTRHAVVKLFEGADNAAAIGCYEDSDADIVTLVQQIMARDQITIAEDAIRLITSRLGSNRMVSRMEIEKLALFAGQGGSLSLDDVSLALGDSATLTISDIASAAADGDSSALKQALAKAWHEDMSVIMVLRGCQGYFRQIEMAALAMANGATAAAAIRTLRPPVHFKIQDKMISQVQFWGDTHGGDALNRLQDAEQSIKSDCLDERVICSQCLLGLSLRAKSLR
jgi:DNA polymerase-3 subunit delta